MVILMKNIAGNFTSMNVKIMNIDVVMDNLYHNHFRRIMTFLILLIAVMNLKHAMALMVSFLFAPEAETNRKMSVRIRFDSIHFIFDSTRFDLLFKI